MRIATLVLAVSLIAINSVAQSGAVGQAFEDEDLGHSFSLRWEHVDLSKCATCFESTAHHTAPYFKDRRLGRAGQKSISPSGEFAVWEDAERGGKLLLFLRSTGEIRDITDGRFVLPKEFRWDEKGRALVITYYQDHAPSHINLNFTVQKESSARN